MKRVLITILFIIFISHSAQAQQSIEVVTTIPAPNALFGGDEDDGGVKTNTIEFDPQDEGIDDTGCTDNVIEIGVNGILLQCVANRFEPIRGVWTQNMINDYIYPSDTTNTALRVGIGTETPEFKLSLDEEGGIIAKGSYDPLSVTLPALTTAGAGTRLIWYPKKAAFRAGRVTGTEWDDANIGWRSNAFGEDNIAAGNLSTIGGGFKNNVTIMSSSGTISGGQNNTAKGAFDTIGGGERNTVDSGLIGGSSTIGGGSQNGINPGSSVYSTVGGGVLNTIVGGSSTIGGGNSNDIAGTIYATIGGGFDNTINTGGVSATISGGASNIVNATAADAVIGGGNTNIVGGTYSTVAGGNDNQATARGAAVGGGDGHRANANEATIAGGLNNLASGAGAFVGGGESNVSSNLTTVVAGGLSNSASAVRATVGGGMSNNVAVGWGTIAGGNANRIIGPSGQTGFIGGGRLNTVNEDLGAIAGGSDNTAGANAFVGGGGNNTASGIGSVVPGGLQNTASGNRSWTGGAGMNSSGDDAFVWGHSDAICGLCTVDVTASDAFIIATGNVGIGTLNPQELLDVNGAARFVLRDFAGLGIPETDPVYYDDPAGGGTGEIGFDIAELFDASEDVEVGDLVIMDETAEKKVKRSDEPYSPLAVGVVSGAPAILFEGSELKIAPVANKFKKGKKAPIALAGRVPCKVTTENGPIRRGDLLTTSSIPGHAMKASDRDKAFGAVIGKAFEPFEGETGVITVIVNLQ